MSKKRKRRLIKWFGFMSCKALDALLNKDLGVNYEGDMEQFEFFELEKLKLGFCFRNRCYLAVVGDRVAG